MKNNIFNSKSKANKILSSVTSATLLFLTVLFVIFNVIYDKVIFLSLAITFGTMFYHFIMRVAVGYFVTKYFVCFLKPDSFWFRTKSFEKKIYRILKVKKWKPFMPTAAPESFSLKNYTPEEIAVTMCSSELVHELNIILSFLPLIMAVPFSKFSVFVITSIAAALCDLPFVIMQRFNRPRMLRFAKRKQ